MSRFLFICQLKNSATKFKMDANLIKPVLICKQFNAFNATYVIHKERTNTKENTPNAFDRMMITAPDKVQVNKNFDKLMNELISYLNENGLDWSKSNC